MKLHFEADLEYQREAVNAVCDLFRGQETSRTEFTVYRSQTQIDVFGSQTAYGNSLELSDESLLANLRKIQVRNRLEIDSTLKSMDFSVEMETGTGKTYVYLRTIFELNRLYDFKKFLIIVPSVAIKEGVYATIQASENHFHDLYGTRAKAVVYDSANLSDVRNFAASSGIQILIMTVGAINKKENVLYQVRETAGDSTPIDLIQGTRPILIVDEPQSVEGGLEGAGRAALQRMNPLFTLRYSATHDPKMLARQHLVYRLTPVDAYDKGLVKQIEVASATLSGGHNRPYLKLLKVRRKKGNLAARAELDIERGGIATRMEVDLEDGDDLEEITKRELYRGLRIGELRTEDGGSLELRTPDGSLYLASGETHGGLDSGTLEREMIRKTIQVHFEKELRLKPQGIKVLSLFFIPSVASYRLFDDAGNAMPGEYAKMFEEEYARLCGSPHYRGLFPDGKPTDPLDKIHQGYFAVDRLKVAGKTVETFKDSREGRTTKADESAFHLIMQAKEKLLDLDNPLRFIFSHSALREGWDNPNVFQICSLREMRSEGQRRQTLGRGLRLCVNQRGERVRGFEVNTLTVIANESYERFAQELQLEIEKETRVRFGAVQRHAFAFLLTNPDQEESLLGDLASERIWDHLRAQGWISADGQSQPALKEALTKGTFTLPAEFEACMASVEELLKKLTARLPIHNADERRSVKVRKEALFGAEFQALWDRVKHHTLYQTSFDPETFILDCVQALKNLPPPGKTRIQWRKASLGLDEAGVTARETATESHAVQDRISALPDLLSALESVTHLTRKSLTRILLQSQRLEDFKRNPQEFIERAGSALNRVKQRTLIRGIRYHRLEGRFYGQELLDKEISGYLRNLVASERSIYDRLVFDSDVEKRFAEALEKDEAVKVYVKLPGWFRIPTPVGPYNPDWAILLEKDGVERVYFVVESKSTLVEEERRNLENDKIACGRAHFEALRVDESGPRYEVATAVDEIIAYAFD